MIYKTLFSLGFISFLSACQPASPDALWVSEDDVVLVEVDGRPITLNMLEFMMENRGVQESDEAGMRALLDELIRLRVVASAAEAEGFGAQSRLRAQRAIRDMEALQLAYFTAIYERYPVTEVQIQQAYDAQIEASGSHQYRLQTLAYPNQSEALMALVELAEGSESLERLAERLGLGTQMTGWVDRSQVPERLRDELAQSNPGDVLSLPLEAPDGSGWLVAEVMDRRPLDAPALSDVRDGITRSLVRRRIEALVEDLYESAVIEPKLEVE